MLVPVLVGGGKRALPNDVRAQLEMLDERRFQSGTVFLRYRARSLTLGGRDLTRRRGGRNDPTRARP